jgi:hypothetical protein
MVAGSTLKEASDLRKVGAVRVRKDPFSLPIGGWRSSSIVRSCCLFDVETRFLIRGPWSIALGSAGLIEIGGLSGDLDGGLRLWDNSGLKW